MCRVIIMQDRIESVFHQALRCIRNLLLPEASALHFYRGSNFPTDVTNEITQLLYKPILYDFTDLYYLIKISLKIQFNQN